MTAKKASADLIVPRTEGSADAILALHARGLTDRQIGREAGFHHASIAAFRNKRGLEPNGIRRRPMELVDGDKVKCSRCGEVKPLEGWPRSRNGTGGEYLLSFCQACKRKRITATANKSEVASLRQRCTRLHFRCRQLGITCTITTADLIEQWEAQRGRCFYTDAPISLELGKGTSWGSFSIDKVEPLRGYVPDNIVITTKRINTIKHDMTPAEMERWTPDWHRRIVLWQGSGLMVCAEESEA